MQSLQRQTVIEQAATFLRKGLHEGRWNGKLPGVRRLAADLDTSHITVRAALRLLESEGLLKPAAAGRSRSITAKAKKQTAAMRKSLRVAILPLQPPGFGSARSQIFMLRLLTAIEHAGHECFIATQALSQLDSNLRRLARLVRDTSADAWVVYSGSHEVLSWFASKQIPVITIGGHSQHVPVACTRSDYTEALQTVIDSLVAQQHRRVVLICPRIWREPDYHPAARVFLERMAHHGLKTSAYNLPSWTETPEGLNELLLSLFKATPPTALLALDPAVAMAVLLFLSEQGLSVPHDVSLISLTSDPIFAKLQPKIAHVDWEIDPHIRRATHWVRDLARNRADKDTKTIQAIFIPGGTIGPAKPI